MNIFLMLKKWDFLRDFYSLFEGVECRIIDVGRPSLVLSVLLFFRLFSASAASQMASAELLIPSASDEESLQLLTFIFLQKNKWIYLVNRMRYKGGRVISQLVISELYVIKYGTYTYKYLQHRFGEWKIAWLNILKKKMWETIY